MNIRTTSLKSYSELKKQGKDITDQERVYMVIKLLPNITDSEIAFMLGYSDKNKVRPRRNELLKEGYIESNGKKICPMTKKLCYRWRIIDK